MIYRTVSSGAIVAKVFRDLGLDRGDWTMDAFEWIGEALEFIGAGPQLVKSEAVLTLASYKSLLPTGLVQLIDVFYAPGITDSADFADAEKYPLRRSGATIAEGVHTTLRSEVPIYDGETYTLNPDYLHSSLETGILGISYLALPVDSNGFPQVPDNIHFKEALTWYITRQLLLRGWAHPSPEIGYSFADREWQYARTKAKNVANMPDIGAYEQFLESWRRLVPESNRRDEFFAKHDTRNANWTYGNLNVDIS